MPFTQFMPQFMVFLSLIVMSINCRNCAHTRLLSIFNSCVSNSIFQYNINITNTAYSTGKQVTLIEFATYISPVCWKMMRPSSNWPWLNVVIFFNNLLPLLLLLPFKLLDSELPLTANDREKMLSLERQDDKVECQHQLLANDCEDMTTWPLNHPVNGWLAKMRGVLRKPSTGVCISTHTVAGSECSPSDSARICKIR